MHHGFSDSAVRLNKFMRDQTMWTPVEMERRSQLLVEQALQIWSAPVVDATLLNAARQRDMQELAQRRDVSKVVMTPTARTLFMQLRERIFELDSTILELAEGKSVSYHGPDFFLEVLPRKHRLVLILPLNFNEVNDPSGFVQDAEQWKFFVYAKHEGGVSLNIDKTEAIEQALPVIRQAYTIGHV